MARVIMVGTSVSMEFFGLPGSGKSTISERVANTISQKGIPIDHHTYILTHHAPRPRRIALKVVRVMMELFLHPAYTLRSTFAILMTRQESLSDLVKVLFNWFFVSSLYRPRVRTQGLRLVDEGVFQALWSIAFSARGDWACRLRALMTVMPMPKVLVIVETSIPNIEYRLKTRLQHDSRLDRHQTLRLLEKAVRICDEIRTNLISLCARREELHILVIKNDQLADLDTSAIRITEVIGPLFRRSAERFEAICE